MTAAHTSATTPSRTAFHTVVVPREHGGWSLTLEPIVLGLLLNASMAGLAFGVATMCIFLAHTPLRYLLVDAYRRRESEHASIARVVALAYGVVMFLCLGFVFTQANPRALWPMLIAIPLSAISLAYDARSRARRTIPELAGAVAMALVAPAIAFLGGAPTSVGMATFTMLALRSLAAMPFVRSYIALRRSATTRLATPGYVGHHVRTNALTQLLVGVLTALAVFTEVVPLSIGLFLGTLCIAHLALIHVKRIPIAAIGVSHTLIGVALVFIAAASLP